MCECVRERDAFFYVDVGVGKEERGKKDEKGKKR